MANLDSRSKRASSVNILKPFMADLVLPDATISQGDRQHIALAYSGILAGAASTLTWSWALEAYISAAWVDLTTDVLTHEYATIASRGIEGNDVMNRVASPGALTTTLDNGSSNSAGLDGYYSLNHANARANFGKETRVRLKFIVNGTPYYKWHGWIRVLDPLPGRFGKRTSFLTAVDYMQKLTEHKLTGIAVQEDKRSDQLFQTIISNVPTAPLNTSIEVDTFATPLALHSEQDERSTAMSVIQKLCETFMLYAFVKGNSTDGETLCLQREYSRITSTPGATLDNTMSELKINADPDRDKNKIIGSIYPSRVDDGADTLLAELTQDYPLDAGDSREIELRFRDPDSMASRISGKNIVTTLVANDHYRMSAFEDTELDDMNSLLTITLTPGGNKVTANVENTGGVRGFINLIKVYGDGIYLYDPVDITVENGSGDKVLNWSFYYLNDHYRARDYLTVILRRKSSGFIEVESVSFLADANLTLMGYAMSLDIGDRVLLQEYMTGLNAEFTINKVTYTINPNGTLRVEWIPEFAESSVDFFTIQDPALGELNGTAVLAPF